MATLKNFTGPPENTKVIFRLQKRDLQINWWHHGNYSHPCCLFTVWHQRRGGKGTHVWHKTKKSSLYTNKCRNWVSGHPYYRIAFSKAQLQYPDIKRSSCGDKKPKRIDNITFTRILVYVWTPEKWTVTTVKGSPYKNHIEQCIIRS